jgi:hypothetical protein
MKKELEGKYAVVTVVSSFRQRYIVPTEELQALNTDVELDETKAIEWVEDSVTTESVKEFSQHWLGENIIDTVLVDEAQVLEIFNKDNKYLNDWTDEKKLNFIRDWKEKQVKGE